MNVTRKWRGLVGGRGQGTKWWMGQGGKMTEEMEGRGRGGRGKGTVWLYGVVVPVQLFVSYSFFCGRRNNSLLYVASQC